DGIGQSLDPNIKLWAGYPGFGVTFMGYNTHDTMDEPPSNNTIQNPFAILPFRECVSNAFDWDAFLLAAVNGWGKQMQGVIPHGMFGHVDDLPLYSYNLTAAVEKWNEAMTYDLADRFLNASDTLTLWFNTGNPVRETVCLQLKDGLTAVMADPSATPLPGGRTLTIDVQSYAWPTYLFYMRRSALANFMIGWLPDYADPDNYIAPFLKGTGTFGMRIGMNHDPNGYNHTMVDGWIADAASELDPVVRAQIYSDIEHEVNDYTCFLYVYQPTSFTTLRAEVNGWWFNPMFSGRYYYYMWKTEATT
ncbi:MAG: ABC transporter substrate-binding protein, partial [Candidatus Thorarchaeota archaeon]